MRFNFCGHEAFVWELAIPFNSLMLAFVDPIHVDVFESRCPGKLHDIEKLLFENVDYMTQPILATMRQTPYSRPSNKHHPCT